MNKCTTGPAAQAPWGSLHVRPSLPSKGVRYLVLPRMAQPLARAKALVLFATTREFLDYFNLTSLDELPTLAEIRDLDAVNQQLDLEEELIPPRTLAVTDRKQMEGEKNEGGESRGDDLGESLDDGEDLSQTRYEADEEESR